MKPAKNRMISTKREAMEPSSEPASRPAVVTVRVVRQPVGENGRAYLAGDTFETTPGRRAALGNLVEEVK